MNQEKGPIVRNGKLYPVEDHKDCCVMREQDAKQLSYEMSTVFPRKLALLKHRSYVAYAT